MIGEGAFGTVHKAKWRGTFVAVKTLKKLKARAFTVQLFACLPRSPPIPSGAARVRSPARVPRRLRCGPALSMRGDPKLRQALTSLPPNAALLLSKQNQQENRVALAEFKTELALIRHLHHPNVVQFLGVLQSEDGALQ